MPIYANGRDTSLRHMGKGPGSGDVTSKTLSMEGVAVDARRPSFFTENGISISRVVASIRGSSSPSVSWTLRFGPTRNGPSTEVLDGGMVTDDEAGGSSHILFSNSQIPGNSFVFLEVTGVSGTVDELSVTIIPELV